MSTEMQQCVLNLTHTTLAEYRDEALDAMAMARIVAHTPTCAACQARLAEWDGLEAAIRAQRVPEPNPRLWEDVRGAAMARARRRLRANGAKMSRRRLLGSVAAVAAVVLLVTGFSQVLHLQAGGQVTTSPTATYGPLPAAGPQLAWRQVSLPPKFGPSPEMLGIGMTAADASLAYACHTSGDGNVPPEIWVTRDQAAHWALVGRLPPAGTVTGCSLFVDRVRADTLLANVKSEDAPTASWAIASYASLDGGRNWTPVGRAHIGAQGREGFQTVAQLSTLNGKVYGLVKTEVYDRSAALAPSIRLSIGANGPLGWRPIDDFFTRSRLYVAAYWADPAADGLLAEVAPMGKSIAATPGGTTQPATQTGEMLWLTRDDGAHWTQLPTPSTGVGEVHAVPLGSGGAWRICGGPICTTDGGRSWAARPALALPVACSDPRCPNGVRVEGTVEGASATDWYLARDGSLITVEPYGPVKDGIIQPEDFAVYRLAADARRWESLGPLPGRLGYVL